MAIERELTYFRYQYIPKDIVLTLDQNYEFRNGTMTYINLIFDFSNNRLPVIQCGIECDNETIAEIYKHQDIAKMNISIDEQKLDEDGRVLATTPYLREVLSLIPARDQTVYITDTDGGVDSRVDKMKLLQHFEFYLVDLEKVKWFDAQRNFSVEKTTFPAMLQSLFMNRGIPGNIIVATPPLQDIELKKVTLPFNTLIGNVRYLNTKYGLYDCAPVVFYDMKYLYCISKRNPNTQMPDTATDFGTVTFTLYDPDDPHHKIQGSVDDPETSTHYIDIEHAPSIIDTTARDAFTKTATIATVDKDGTVETDQTNESEDDEATKITYVYRENDLTKAQVYNELITGPTVNLVAKDISVKFLRPYKDYNFRVGNSYMNLDLVGRTFRLLRYGLEIRRDGVDKYLSETSITLYCPVRDVREEEPENA